MDARPRSSPAGPRRPAAPPPPSAVPAAGGAAVAAAHARVRKQAALGRQQRAAQLPLDEALRALGVATPHAYSESDDFDSAHWSHSQPPRAATAAASPHSRAQRGGWTQHGDRDNFGDAVAGESKDASWSHWSVAPSASASRPGTGAAAAASLSHAPRAARAASRPGSGLGLGGHIAAPHVPGPGLEPSALRQRVRALAAQLDATVAACCRGEAAGGEAGDAFPAALTDDEVPLSAHNRLVSAALHSLSSLGALAGAEGAVLAKRLASIFNRAVWADATTMGAGAGLGDDSNSSPGSDGSKPAQRARSQTLHQVAHSLQQRAHYSERLLRSLTADWEQQQRAAQRAQLQQQRGGVAASSTAVSAGTASSSVSAPTLALSRFFRQLDLLSLSLPGAESLQRSVNELQQDLYRAEMRANHLDRERGDLQRKVELLSAALAQRDRMQREEEDAQQAHTGQRGGGGGSGDGSITSARAAASAVPSNLRGGGVGVGVTGGGGGGGGRLVLEDSEEFRTLWIAHQQCLERCASLSSQLRTAQLVADSYRSRSQKSGARERAQDELVAGLRERIASMERAHAAQLRPLTPRPEWGRFPLLAGHGAPLPTGGVGAQSAAAQRRRAQEMDAILDGRVLVADVVGRDRSSNGGSNSASRSPSRGAPGPTERSSPAKFGRAISLSVNVATPDHSAPVSPRNLIASPRSVSIPAPVALSPSAAAANAAATTASMLSASASAASPAAAPISDESACRDESSVAIAPCDTPTRSTFASEPQPPANTASSSDSPSGPVTNASVNADLGSGSGNDSAVLSPDTSARAIEEEGEVATETDPDQGSSTPAPAPTSAPVSAGLPVTNEPEPASASVSQPHSPPVAGAAVASSAASTNAAATPVPSSLVSSSPAVAQVFASGRLVPSETLAAILPPGCDNTHPVHEAETEALVVPAPTHTFFPPPPENEGLHFLVPHRRSSSPPRSPPPPQQAAWQSQSQSLAADGDTAAPSSSSSSPPSNLADSTASRLWSLYLAYRDAVHSRESLQTRAKKVIGALQAELRDAKDKLQVAEAYVSEVALEAIQRAGQGGGGGGGGSSSSLVPASPSAGGGPSTPLPAVSTSSRHISKYLIGLGTGPEVPLFLRATGKVRNRNMGKRECEGMLQALLAARGEYFRAAVATTTSDAPEPSPAPAGSARGSQAAPSSSQSSPPPPLVHLSEFLYMFLKRRLGSMHSLIVETGYSFLDALERFRWDADCALGLKMLRGEVHEGVYSDQLHMVASLVALLSRLDAALHPAGKVGKVPKTLALYSLKNFFPLKTPSELHAMARALNADQPGQVISIAALFAERDDAGSQGAFAERVRGAHLAEVEEFMIDLQDRVARLVDGEAAMAHAGGGGGGGGSAGRGEEGSVAAPATVSLGDIRQAWASLDPDRSISEIDASIALALDDVPPPPSGASGAAGTGTGSQAVQLPLSRRVVPAAFFKKLFGRVVVKRARNFDPSAKPHVGLSTGLKRAYAYAPSPTSASTSVSTSGSAPGTARASPAAPYRSVLDEHAFGAGGAGGRAVSLTHTDGTHLLNEPGLFEGDEGEGAEGTAGAGLLRIQAAGGGGAGGVIVMRAISALEPPTRQAIEAQGLAAAEEPQTVAEAGATASDRDSGAESTRASSASSATPRRSSHTFAGGSLAGLAGPASAVSHAHPLPHHTGGTPTRPLSMAPPSVVRAASIVTPSSGSGGSSARRPSSRALPTHASGASSVHASPRPPAMRRVATAAARPSR